MAENNPVERIQPGNNKELTKTGQENPNQAAFEKHLNSPNTIERKSVEETTQSSSSLGTKPTLASVKGQVNTVGASLDSLQGQLEANAKVKMKKQHSRLLENNLKKANTHIQSASTKLGVPSSSYTPKGTGPIRRFLGYVTNGQRQILAAKKQLETLKTEDSLNPAALISVQVKLSQAQQELEYSSILLGKVVDMFKQMMNIQI